MIQRYLLLAAFIVASVGLQAQSNIQFQSGLDKTSAQVGEAVHFGFMVDGSDQVEIPNWPDNADYSVQYEGGAPRNSTTTYSINGKVSTEVKKSFSGSFLLRPKHQGIIQIPARNFKVQGKIIQSDPTSLEVTAARKNDRYRLRWSAPSTSLIEGQPLRLKLEFLYADNVRALNFSFPFLTNPDITWDNPVAPSTTNDMVAFQSGGKQWYGRKTTTQLDGRQYNSVEIQMTGHPQRTGTLRLEGFAADISAKTGTETVRDFFDRQVQQDKYDDLSLMADPLVISVRSLPESGKPASYFGLVGRLTMDASMAASTVSLGDPVELKISLKGLQNQVDPQSEIERQMMELSHLKVSLKDRKVSDDGGVDYVWLVRFTKAGDQAVEPVVLDYFDPRSGQYHQASTRRIAVQVKDATIVAANNVVGNWGSAASTTGMAPDRALFVDATWSLPVLGLALPPWIVPLLLLPLWLIIYLLGLPAGRLRRTRRRQLQQLLVLDCWDEDRLQQLLPSDWWDQQANFDRLRYSPPSAERESWLRDIKELCRKELAR